MLLIGARHLDEISAHGERDYPYECCGLLLGHFENERKVVTEIFPISNAREEAAKRNRFLITPAELLRGEQHAALRGVDVVGFYHSHPDHPSVPSQYDLEHAWPVYSYIVVAIHNGRRESLRSWEMKADRSRFIEEEISLERN